METRHASRRHQVRVGAKPGTNHSPEPGPISPGCFVASALPHTVFWSDQPVDVARLNSHHRPVVIPPYKPLGVLVLDPAVRRERREALEPVTCATVSSHVTSRPRSRRRNVRADRASGSSSRPVDLLASASTSSRDCSPFVDTRAANSTSESCALDRIVRRSRRCGTRPVDLSSFGRHLALRRRHRSLPRVVARSLVASSDNAVGGGHVVTSVSRASRRATHSYRGRPC